MKILLITEQREGKFNKVSFETLAAAQQIVQHTKGSLTGLVIGKGLHHLPTNSPARNSTKSCSSNTTCSKNTRRTDSRSPCVR